MATTLTLDLPELDEGPGVYVAWSHSGAALYVGESTHWLERLVQHSRQKPWWDDVASVTVEPEPDPVTRLAVEQDLIDLLLPETQRGGNTSTQPGGTRQAKGAPRGSRGPTRDGASRTGRPMGCFPAGRVAGHNEGRQRVS